MKWKRRIYLLNNNRIPSGRVEAYLHRARKDKSEECVSCQKPILKGQEYLRQNTAFGFLTHKDCYLGDWGQPLIVAVKVNKTTNIYGFSEVRVTCEQIVRER
jgi:hypothetical protein